MNTKLLMTASALLLGLAGILLSFLPREILGYFNPSDAPGSAHLVLQILGAVYFGFAMLNWTAKDSLLGGIYSRPVTLGNFTHFMIGAFALIKGYADIQEIALLAAAIFYILFALLFGYVLFTHPISKKPEG